MFRVCVVSSAATRAMTRSFSTANKKVGFIGLGNMGKSMASNLLKSGHQLVVYDMVSAPVKELEAHGAQGATNVADVAKNVDTLITMLPSSPHVKEVYLQHVFDNINSGSLLIDCSTIDPNVSREVAREALAKQLHLVDAPVSGGVGGAAAGTLTFMVGAKKEDFEASKQYLNAMGKNIVHCGDVGTGQIAKLCNNLILGISMMGVSEAMNLGVKLGADPKVLAGIINTSSGRCWSSDTYNPVPGVMENVPSANDYNGGFGTALMQKDLGLASDAAKSVNAPLPLGGLSYNVYSMLSNCGLGKKDFGVIYQYLAGKSPGQTEH